MRKLTFGMNLSLDGYIAAPGDDLGWNAPRRLSLGDDQRRGWDPPVVGGARPRDGRASAPAAGAGAVAGFDLSGRR
jgi:hypothetical protein